MNGMSGLFLGLPPDSIKYVLIALAIIQLAVSILLAVAVKEDAEALGPTRLFLISPWLWAVIVLVTGGYIGAFAYWVIHYSILGHRNEGKN